MHYPETSSTDDRWPGLLSQTAFYRCFKTMMMHFSTLSGINRTAWGTRLLLMTVSAHPVDCTSSGPILKGTALLLESKWLLWPAFGFPAVPASPHPPPAHPAPIDSIHDITGSENIYSKKQQHSSSW